MYKTTEILDYRRLAHNHVQTHSQWSYLRTGPKYYYTAILADLAHLDYLYVRDWPSYGMYKLLYT